MRALALLVLVAFAACNAEKSPPADAAHPGQVVFKQQCGLCHTVDGSRSTGPSLVGVIGRPAASLAGFPYTKAMRESGLTWDAATLDAFLANPTAKLPGSMMVTGVPDAAQRAAVIGYLQTLKAQ
ncbi:MAG: cytochrome c family protein [Myxococcota bacterium]|nr:c-type cytochrome [Myxococcota bacterium]